MKELNKNLRISADTLKIISIVLMAVSVIGSGFVIHCFPEDYLINKLSNNNFYDIFVQSQREKILTGISNASALIGGICIPIVVFLMIEGYLYSVNKKTYFLMMVIAAIITEIPYSLFLSHDLCHFNLNNLDWNFTSGSPMLAVLLASVMIYFMNMSRLVFHKAVWIMAYVAAVLAGLMASVVTRTNFGVNENAGIYIIFIAAVMYLFYNKTLIRNIIIIVLSVLLGFYLAPLSLIILYFYDDSKPCIIKPYLFLAAYPLLLFIGAVI